MSGAKPPLPNTPSSGGGQLKKSTEQLYLTFYYQIYVWALSTLPLEPQY